MPQSAYFSSADIDLVKDVFYTIEIKYAEGLGLSKIKLFWESDSQKFELISSEKLSNLLNSATTPFLFEVVPASTN